MMGRQIDLLEWYAQKMYCKSWSEVVKGFAEDHLQQAIHAAKQEALDKLTVDDLMFHLENAQNDESQVSDAT